MIEARPTHVLQCLTLFTMRTDGVIRKVNSAPSCRIVVAVVNATTMRVLIVPPFHDFQMRMPLSMASQWEVDGIIVLDKSATQLLSCLGFMVPSVGYVEKINSIVKFGMPFRWCPVYFALLQK